ncbi:MAG: hypothetical protein Q4B08_14665 [Propionibacteriaceae bacterium]|nr:hypothetical protein [Propionibacteriaceae bacterium]
MTSWAKAGPQWHQFGEANPSPADNRQILLPEFIGGAVLVFEALSFRGISYSLYAVVALCGIGLFRRPRLHARWLSGFPVAALLGLAYIGLVSALGYMPTGTWAKRELRIGASLVFVWMMATGRLHVMSILKGYLLGIGINLAAFYAGIAPRPYGELLSGWFGDKNRAGLAHALIGLLALSLVRRAGWFVVVAVVVLGSLWLTGSRTSTAAFGLGLCWFFMTRRAPLGLRAIIAVALWWLFGFVQDRFANVGAFADRTGSDLLRARIDLAAWAKVEAAPWHGVGLGSGNVVIGEEDWYFHNAFWTMLVEGGWPFLMFALGLTVLIGFRVVTPRPITWTQAAAEAAAFAVLVCATRLGDVFFTVAWAVVLGFAGFASAGEPEPGLVVQKT